MKVWYVELCIPIFSPLTQKLVQILQLDLLISNWDEQTTTSNGHVFIAPPMVGMEN